MGKIIDSNLFKKIMSYRTALKEGHNCVLCRHAVLHPTLKCDFENNVYNVSFLVLSFMYCDEYKMKHFSEGRGEGEEHNFVFEGTEKGGICIGCGKNRKAAFEAALIDTLAKIKYLKELEDQLMVAIDKCQTE